MLSQPADSAFLPSAATESSLITELVLRGDGIGASVTGARVTASAFTSAVAFSSTTSAVAQSLAPDSSGGGLSLYRSGAQAWVDVRPQVLEIEAGLPEGAIPLLQVSSASATLADALYDEPFFARAAAGTQAGLSGVVITTGRESSIDISWTMIQRSATAAAPASAASIVDSVLIYGVSPTGRRLIGGARLASQQTGSVASSDPLGVLAAPSAGADAGQAAAPAAVRVSVALPADQEGLSIDIVAAHRETSEAAALRAAVPVLAAAGHLGNRGRASPALHWDAAAGVLSFDPIPVDWTGGLFEGANLTAGTDPAKLMVSDLLLAGEADGRLYFSGGDLSLTDDAGAVLLRLELPTMVFEERLYETLGFNLFAPLLGLVEADVETGSWPDRFLSVQDAMSPFIPELFLGADLSELPLDPWGQSFSAPLEGLLSFSGIEAPLTDQIRAARVSSPQTSVLLAIGLAALGAGRRLGWPPRA